MAEEVPPALPSEWVMKLLIRRGDGRPPTQFLIQVNDSMTPDSLSACVEQACASLGGASEAAHVPHPIAGLFIQRSGLFVSLDHLLKTSALRSEVFGLSYFPPPPARPPPLPWYQQRQFLLLASGPIVVMALHQSFVYFGPQIWRAMSWTSKLFFDMTVQLPLQELYRYGPWFIGWEGASLPSVCARITYYGDAPFWRRNMEECEEIYAVKEEAFLRIARPTVYIVVFLFLLWLFMQLLQHWQQLARYRHAARNNQNPEMVETYRAFQVLLRNIRKGLEPSHPPPPAGGSPPGRFGRRDRNGANFR